MRHFPLIAKIELRKKYQLGMYALLIAYRLNPLRGIHSMHSMNYVNCRCLVSYYQLQKLSVKHARLKMPKLYRFEFPKSKKEEKILMLRHLYTLCKSILLMMKAKRNNKNKT